MLAFLIKVANLALFSFLRHAEIVAKSDKRGICRPQISFFHAARLGIYNQVRRLPKAPDLLLFERFKRERNHTL